MCFVKGMEILLFPFYFACPSFTHCHCLSLVLCAAWGQASCSVPAETLRGRTPCPAGGSTGRAVTARETLMVKSG